MRSIFPRSSLSFSKDGRDILKFSFHSSGTTVCETKLSNHSFVCPGRIQNLLALASRVCVCEKAISRIRIVLLLWETHKRLKRARFNSKQAIKNRSIFCFAMLVLIFDFGARACYSTTWYSWRHRFHFCLDPTVHTLARTMYGFVFIHFRERFQTYTDSVDPIRVLVWTEGLNVSKSIRLRTNPRECGRALRPRPHVAGYFRKRRIFSPNTATVHM